MAREPVTLKLDGISVELHRDEKGWQASEESLGESGMAALIGAFRKMDAVEVDGHPAYLAELERTHPALGDRRVYVEWSLTAR